MYMHRETRTYIYRIHNRAKDFYKNSYRKFSKVGLKPRTTEMLSDTIS